MTIPDALLVLRPTARQFADYLVSDDGSGARITRWSHPSPEPTAAEIAAVTPQQVAAARQQRAAALAVQETLGSLTPSAVSARVILRYTLTELNILRAAVGLGRIEEPQHLAGILAFVQAGAGDPIGSPG